MGVPQPEGVWQSSEDSASVATRADQAEAGQPRLAGSPISHMIKAGLQSKALADAGMSGLLNQIRYKAQRRGTRVVEADR